MEQLLKVILDKILRNLVSSLPYLLFTFLHFYSHSFTILWRKTYFISESCHYQEKPSRNSRTDQSLWGNIVRSSNVRNCLFCLISKLFLSDCSQDRRWWWTTLLRQSYGQYKVVFKLVLIFYYVVRCLFLCNILF